MPGKGSNEALLSADKHNENRRIAKAKQRANTRRTSGGAAAGSFLEGLGEDRRIAREEREANNRSALFLAVSRIIARQQWSQRVKDAAYDYVAFLLVGLDDYMVSMECVVLNQSVQERLQGFFCDAILATHRNKTPRDTPGQQAEWFNSAIAAANARRKAAKLRRPRAS